MEMQLEVCPICNGKVFQETLVENYRTIEISIQVGVCCRCKEKFYSSSTLRLLERTKLTIDLGIPVLGLLSLWLVK